jgi:UDP-glucuronate 4-epimerase
MKILITGHEGFIGTHLINKLKGSGIQWDGYDLINGDDVRNKLRLEKVIEAGNYDFVVHMAALAGVRRGEEYPDEYISTNVLGTKNIVDLCNRYKVKLIFFSSSSVLGGNPRDDENGLVEEMQYNPKSLYAITKVAGEQIVSQCTEKYFIIRPFTVYGENGRPDMVIYKWIHQIKKGLPISFYGDGTTTRGYTHVEDLVNALIVLMKKIERGEILVSSITLHLGGSEQIYLKDVFRTFVNYNKAKGKNVDVEYLPLPKEDVFDSFAYTGKAKILLGFEPKPNFNKILNKILQKEL